MRMNALSFLFVAMTGSVLSAGGTERIGQTVSVEIWLDDGRFLPLYPTPSKGGDGFAICDPDSGAILQPWPHREKRAYAEAIRGGHYRISIKNNQPHRVGLVIAVDGRNIVSGTPSNMGSHERMYVLDAYATGDFNGWRTSSETINRFVFTSENRSYAGAFGDTSAMGAHHRGGLP